MRPEERYEHPNSPVRDDDALAPGEDLDRDADGIPHRAMAAIVVATLIFAAILLIVVSGHAPKNTGAVLVIGIGIPVLFAAIFLGIRRRREHGAHASR